MRPAIVKSTIIETGEMTKIITPKTPSWLLISLFCMLIIQNVYGFIRGLFFETKLDPTVKTYILIFCPLILFFIVKGLLLQIKGKRILEIYPDKIILRKTAPLKFKTRSRKYLKKDIKSVQIKDETLAVGAERMLQILGITDPITITFKKGFDTIHAIGGFDLVEATEIEKLIKSKF